MKARDSTSVSALAAIENAEAVDVATPTPPPPVAEHPHIAGSVAGLGNAEVERRVLGEDEVEQLVREEAKQRQSVALDLDRGGHHQRAAQLRAEADVLLRYMPP
jgi:hypothetical protein